MAKKTRRLLIEVDGVGKRKCGDCAMATPSPMLGGGQCLEFGVGLQPTKSPCNFWRCDECLRAEGRATALNYGPPRGTDPLGNYGAALGGDCRP